MKLINGDCLEVMRYIPDNSIDMVLTDIPYNEVNRASGGLRNLNKGIADSEKFNMIELLDNINRVTTGSVYIFCGISQLSHINDYFRAIKGVSTRVIVWEKNNPSPLNCNKLWVSGVELCLFARYPNATYNCGYSNTVLKYPTTKSKIHPTQKPINLFREIIIKSSNKGDTILDPFMGSGTTGLVCKKLNRNFIGIEKNVDFYNSAYNRIMESNNE